MILVAESNSSGLLSSLLGSGCECEGYTVRIVGHSLGGAIAALLGIRVWIIKLQLDQIKLFPLFDMIPKLHMSDITYMTGIYACCT